MVRGTDPAELTRRAVAALGGIERFVKPGQTVIVKPNICHAPRGVEYGTTTHPDVVGALVALAVAAGARTVQVMDAPFASSPKEAYDRSGIADAVQAAGGEMVLMSSLEYAKTPIPLGRSLKRWSVYTPALKADVIIDVPVAKHHGSAGLSLGMKNLMGLLEPKGRGAFHGNLHQNIADLSTLFQPKLTVVDAMRTLMANGPTGGSLDDVKQQNTVFASADIVAADAYATTLFDKRPDDIRYIVIGRRNGARQRRSSSGCASRSLCCEQWAVSSEQWAVNSEKRAVSSEQGQRSKVIEVGARQLRRWRRPVQIVALFGFLVAVALATRPATAGPLPVAVSPRSTD